MRVLADAAVALSTIDALRTHGHDVVHVRDLGLQRADDAVILARAKLDGRVVATFDLDFGDLMAAGGDILPSVVIMRLNDQSAPNATTRLLNSLETCKTDLDAGAVVIVEESRNRVRKLPFDRD